MLSEQIEPRVKMRLEQYVKLLQKWKGVTNLISEAALQEIWSRHIPDGVRLHRLFPAQTKWLDLGSGAGLPSVVLGCLLADCPGSRIYCVDSDGRKCAFLRNAARELQIPIKVLNARADKISKSDLGPVEMITARAFASVSEIVSLAAPFIAEGAILILPRGESSRSEIEALDAIRYEVAEHEGLASGNGFFLEIRRRASRS